MFGFFKREKNPEHVVSVLAQGCQFNGKLFCRGNCLVSGSVEGEILSEGELTIEASAYINAKITGKVVIINGPVQGDVFATTIELGEGAELLGDITCEELHVSPGAKFSGRSHMKVEVVGATPSLPTYSNQNTSTLDSNYGNESSEDYYSDSSSGGNYQNDYSSTNSTTF